MKQKLLLKSLVLLFALITGSTSVWADDVVGTINFGSASGSTNINSASVTGNDSQGNEWTITTEGTTSFTPNASYAQVGSGSKPAKSITFTTTLPSSQTIKAFSAKFGGFSATAGDVTLKVGSTTVGSGNLDATNDVIVSATNTTTSGTVLTVTVTGISKGVKCYYISYTYESSALSSNATFANKTPSVDWPTNTTYKQTATTAEGYAGTAGASVTYSIGSTNTCGATINASTGEVSFTKGGTVIVNATAAEIAGQFSQSSDSYTLTVNDVRSNATLSWSESSVEIFKDAASYTLPTLNNPNSLEVNYEVEGTDGLASVTPAGVVTVNTGTVGTATVKAIFAGNNSYKPKTVSYTIDVVDPSVKGTKYNPYTVTEVRAVSTSTTISDVYVEGWIVGYVNSTYNFTNNESDFKNTNWAIADSKSETDKDKTAPVQISGTPTQTNYGLSNHPELVGAKVLIKGDITKYFDVSGVKYLDEISIVSVPATINSTYEWATFSYNKPLDFTGTGVSAYIVTGFEGSAVTKTRVYKVPANTGLLLNGTTDNIPLATGDLNDVSANKMVAVTTATTISKVDGKTRYVLADKGGKAMFLSINAIAANIPAGKAYLEIDGDGARELYFDDTTVINALENATKIDNGAIYDLSGRRVENPTKGIYIINGKKVIFK